MDTEPRVLIPICKKHGRFQTVNHRWLNISEDLENHIIYTGSQDAILSEGECDMCATDINQIEIDFEEVKPESEYKSAYDKILSSGMFWELHPELTGKWNLDKEEFINFHN